MKLKFDVSVDEYKIINSILKSHLAPSSQVWVFGSRAKNTARFNSDLDLAIESDKPLTQKEMVMLKESFNESRLPYKVDVVDMNNVDISFRDIIHGQKVLFLRKGNEIVPKLRIATFLTTVDNKIQFLTQKKEALSRYKKGLLQTLFPTAGETVPELRFPGFSEPWVEKRIGAGVSNLYFRYLEKIRLPLPSLPEQKKIANFLTEVDTKITKVEGQIATMTQFKKGLLQQMFV